MWNPHDWYYRVGTQDRVYSSASDSYVPLTDPRYMAWKASDPARQPAVLNSEHHLRLVLLVPWASTK
jgi:hypothetical protein